MIGIENIGYYLPERTINNLERLEQFDTSEDFVTNKTGVLRVAVKEEDQDTSDICCEAFKNLHGNRSIDKDEIDCIVVCTQNPDGYGLPHTSAMVHAKLELPDTCAAFDISLGCSGYVYGLSLIQGFMNENGYTRGILFTADPYSKIIDPSDKNTSLLFGDAATATLISDTPVWKTGKFLFGSHGHMSNAIEVDARTCTLAMNGRAVFNFTATVVPRNIKEMLAHNSTEIDEVDLFALHQASRFVLDNISRRLKIQPEKMPFVAAEYGNTVSSSIPMILKDQVDSSHKKIAIAGFGVGLSWGSTLLLKC